MNIGNMLFSAKGRIRRRDWWLWSLAALLIYYVVCFIAGFALALAGVLHSGDTAAANGLAIILLPIFLWPNVCLTAKRWHDRDKSGWMALISFVPILSLWTLVECGFLDGTPGPNKYGPSPKMPLAPTDVF